jgi:hypothetical protein
MIEPSISVGCYFTFSESMKNNSNELYELLTEKEVLCLDYDCVHKFNIIMLNKHIENQFYYQEYQSEIKEFDTETIQKLKENILSDEDIKLEIEKIKKHFPDFNEQEQLKFGVIVLQS